MERFSTRRLVTAYATGGVKALGPLLEAWAPTDRRFDALAQALGRPDAGVPAAWFLRSWLRLGFEPSLRSTERFLEECLEAKSNEARLLACQALERLDIPGSRAEVTARFLRDAARGDHKFTRAWAVDAFDRLARQHPTYRQEAALLLDRASRDGAASVRARVRQILGRRP